MNINQLMRSLLGETTAAEPRALELKIGQVVRGMVVKMTDSNEAIVQINGLQVRARLDYPLQAGQSALLQVMPESNEGLIMLKPLQNGTGALAGDSAAEWLKQLKLPDQPWAHALLDRLKTSGTRLTPELSRHFSQAMVQMPAEADPEQWLQSAATAYERGLPATADTIQGLRQVQFGTSVDRLLLTLRQQLGEMAEQNGGRLPEAASNADKLLAEGLCYMGYADGTTEGRAGTGAAGNLYAAAGREIGVSAKSAFTRGAEPFGIDESARMMTANSSAGPEGSETGGAKTGQHTNWLGQMMKWLGVDYEHNLARELTAGQNGVGSGVPDVAAGQRQSNVDGTGRNSTVSRQTAPPLYGEGAAEPAAAGANGTDASDNRPAILPDKSGGGLPLEETGREAFSRGAVPAGAEDEVRGAQDTFKSALLSLAASDDTPPAVKETAQQLVQHITGQQLMMAPERNGALFSHLMLHIPIVGQDGSRTASVHVQTRRGRKGELDAENCRLLFDLSMRTIGDTLVDVNVTDKIVSLTLWNDHPSIGALAETFKQEMAERMSETGYQLLSLKTRPFPDDAGGEADNPPEMNGRMQMQPPVTADYATYRYKGVDYRA